MSLDILKMSLSFTENQIPHGFPTIDMGPQLKVVERTRTATMLCAASGNPDPEISWFKDMLPVDISSSNGRIKQLRSGSWFDQILFQVQLDLIRFYFLKEFWSCKYSKGKLQCTRCHQLPTDMSYARHENDVKIINKHRSWNEVVPAVFDSDAWTCNLPKYRKRFFFTTLSNP